MAIDPEELKKRRAQRQQYQTAKKRKFWIRICVAAVIVLLCGILIFTLLPGGSQQEQADQPTAPQPSASPSTPQETTEPVPETTVPTQTTIHLAFGGDVNVSDRVIASGGGVFDYTKVFMDVAHILAEADLTMVNFEGNLCGAPYGSSTGSAPQELAEALWGAGVDLVQLANSYAINRGISGLSNTIDGIRAAGMEPLGVYKDRNAFRSGKGYTIQNVNGVKIAFVAFTKGMDGMALPAGSEDCVNLLYTDYESSYQQVDTEGITQILRAAKEEEPDIIIAMLHWGSEYNDVVSTSQEKIVKLMQENGVDAIIGTHSHYVQQMVFDPEQGTFVAYSLGDLLSDGTKSGTQYSVILDLEITKDLSSGEAKITGYSYTPIYTVNEMGKDLRVVRIHEAMAAYEDSFIGAVGEPVYEDMQYALTRIEDRIHGK